MLVSTQLPLDKDFNIYGFLLKLNENRGPEDFFVFDKKKEDEETITYFFSRYQISTTPFSITIFEDDALALNIDCLAAYEDFQYYPELLDFLSRYLTGEDYRIEVEGQAYSAEEFYDEEWIDFTIGEGVAMLKAILAVSDKCFIAQAQCDYYYVTKELFSEYAVGLTSSTPRIYGYLQLMMGEKLLPQATELEAQREADNIPDSAQDMVDVPQHESIGEVKSWQTDGAETWESYSKEDVQMLLGIALAQSNGEFFCGEVLNDIGTLYHEGVGVEKDGKQAEHWFKEAIKAGDRYYAPNNLGDLYRKGAGNVKVSLKKAFKAYLKSEDPYGYYRVGQGYEQGWNGEIDMESAMLWYVKAAEEGHHLALKRLQGGNVVS